MIISATLFLVAASFVSSKIASNEFFVGLDTVQMIQKYGYPVENHYITTEDGYILTYQRIPHGAFVDNPGIKPTVLLMHGMTSSSADFVNMGPTRSISYILADLGYDVWIGNARGNAWSRNHTTFNVTSNPEIFFDFSWHEIGFYDLPAAIAYIMDVTGAVGLYYVGHSQGGTSLLVMGATRPEYNDKIKLACLMGPASFMEYQNNRYLATFSKYIYDIENLLWKYHIYELPEPKLMQAVLSFICSNPKYYKICESIIYLFDGDDSDQFDDNIFPVILSNLPSNVAVKQFLHYGQLIKNGGFRQYDHGTKKNLEIYGSETPPEYNLSLITAPVAVYYGENDGFVKVKDIETLVTKLPNVVSNYLVPYTKFNHLDFLFANDVRELYYIIMNLMLLF